MTGEHGKSVKVERFHRCEHGINFPTPREHCQGPDSGPTRPTSRVTTVEEFEGHEDGEPARTPEQALDRDRLFECLLALELISRESEGHGEYGTPSYDSTLDGIWCLAQAAMYPGGQP